jgi:TonB family protein
MNTIINYTIEVNLGLILFYALYVLLLRRETDFRANRVYLLASLAISLIFPLFSLTQGVQPNAIPSVSYMLPELIVGEAIIAQPVETNIPAAWLLFYAYMVVTVVLLGYFIYQLCRLILFLVNSPSKTVNGMKIVESSRAIPPFSFFNWIVIGQAEALSDFEKEQILNHERAHASQGHSIDLIFINLVRIFFWFNPATWLYKTTLQQLHEFEADQRSTDEKSLLPYCTVLAKVAMAQSGFAMAHHFNKSLTLKRIKMMNTFKEQMKRWKVVTAFSVAVVFFVAVACQDQLDDVKTVTENSTMALKMPQSVSDRLKELETESPLTDFVVIQMNEEGKKTMGELPTKEIARMEVFHFQNPETKENESFAIIEMNKNVNTALDRVQTGDIFTIVEESALPEGGIEKFYEHIAATIKYPLEARRQGIQGRVFVEFIVKKDGTLSDVRPVKGIGVGCDEEAVRVISTSPIRWTSAKQRGMAVNQRMVLPITFKLETNQTGTVIFDEFRPSNSKFDVKLQHTANSGVIKGKVTEEGGAPLAGVNIVVSGTTQGTITDLEGNFSITPMAKGGRLVFSFVGYDSKEVMF